MPRKDLNPSAQRRAGLRRKPPWLAVPPPWSSAAAAVRACLREGGLHTVCEEARCPNLGECFGRGTATFLAMGDVCTRSCRFCNVKEGTPAPLDPAEPRRLARAVARLKLTFAVVTSVTRDDLADGGASHLAAIVRAIREEAPGTSVELLIPDLGGEEDALATVLEARPDVLNHNIETVERLYPAVRPQADYGRSLELLARAARHGGPVVKSGLMVGLGEEPTEVLALLDDLRTAGVQSMTIGQYLPPSAAHAPLVRYVDPSEFAGWAEAARLRGFTHVASAPLVRSSYHAERGATASGSPSGPGSATDRGSAR